MMYAFVNGEHVPETEAKISIFDRGFTMGEAVFDSTRTFGGKAFKLEEHLERLRKSVNYLELDGARIVADARTAVNDVVSRNRDEIAAVDDVAIYVYVSSGVSNQRTADRVPPTLVVSLRKLEHAVMAPLYESGVDLGVSLGTRHFQGATDRRVKTTNRLAAARGRWKSSRATRVHGPASGWTVVFADDGSISEAAGANVCLIQGRTLVRPYRHEALEGVSLETACELAARLGLKIEERPIWLYDILNADEVLLTASSFQLLPIASIDGITLSSKRDVYERLLAGWFELAGLDFVAQSKAHQPNVARMSALVSR